jgi:DNA-binding transcriptional ArsR family regulator
MAYSKAHFFDPLTYNQSFWSKALSHPARIIILTYLLEHGITPFYVFAKIIPLARPTISQHIRILRQAGLIDSFEMYPNTYYQLNFNTCKDLALKIKSLNKSFLEA